MKRDNKELMKQLPLLLCMLLQPAMAGEATLCAQTAPAVPRLVVNVVIDQLRTDYLEAFVPLYGQGGFRKLMQQACVCQQAEYPFAEPDRASAMACLMTGAMPYENGIVGERWLDRNTLQPTGSTDDYQQTGYFTNEKASPLNLGVSTISDELKVSTHGNALVYAIAPNVDAAIFGAGHAADGAFWINDETGQWCATSYYGTYPNWLADYNGEEHAARQIDKLTWTPSEGFAANFNYFAAKAAKKPFRYNFRGDRRFREFKASPLVNEEVNDFAAYLLAHTLMGVDAVPDMLNITLYAGNFDHKTVSECPMEMQDTYVRLDSQLERLITMMEDKVGRENLLLVVTGTGYSDADQTADNLKRYRIPSGEFNITRAQTLLNMYLGAVYGRGNYIEASMGNQLFLDRKFIEDKGLHLSEILERSADFLIKLSGVREVFTSQRLVQGVWNEGGHKIRNAYNPKCSGDILVEVSPGWTLVNEQTNEHKQLRDSYIGFPLYFYGLNIPAETVKTPVTVDHVAPTLAQFMRIRAPNACTASPLMGMKKEK